MLVEKTIFTDDVHIVGAVGYEAGSEVPVYSDAFSVAGTLSATNPDLCPGACAALIRYATTARSSKNHPVYLFNYYHGVLRTIGGSADTLNASQKTAMQAYADDWLAGFSDGSHTLVRAGPNGATATSRTVQDNITHRDFPR